MALGGGTFVTQNKILPGSYINFVSAAAANPMLSGRGIATMPLPLSWGPLGEVFEVTAEDMQKRSMKIFGYDYTHEKMKGLRDLFRNANTLYVYRLGAGKGTAAKSTHAEALYPGVRGNDIKIVITKNVDEQTHWDVTTYLGTIAVDEQKNVEDVSGLKPNDYVKFTEEALAEATETLAGGADPDVDGEDYQAYLDKIENYTYNGMGIIAKDKQTKELCAAFCKRLRDERGVKFQMVVQDCAADYLGVVNVKNKTVTDDNFDETGLVYWVAGLVAGTAVNKSAQNRVYDGDFAVEADFTQAQLEAAISAGEFALHRVGRELRVLADINSMVTVSDTQGDVFKDNQTVRVIDQIANDIAVLFNTKYLGAVPNDNAGRMSLWADIVKHHEQLEDIRAITDFDENSVKVYRGNTPKAVAVDDVINVVNAMDKLYMTVTVE